MSVIRTMPDIDHALFEESWEWLQDNIPTLADAVYREVKRGANDGEIRAYVMRRTQRPALAMRCQQAAAHLMSMNGEQK